MNETNGFCWEFRGLFFSYQAGLSPTSAAYQHSDPMIFKPRSTEKKHDDSCVFLFAVLGRGWDF